MKEEQLELAIGKLNQYNIQLLLLSVDVISRSQNVATSIEPVCVGRLCL
ncbi:MAG: hypothetical protein ACM37W_11595 [Actinomycetota bacterium]